MLHRSLPLFLEATMAGVPPDAFSSDGQLWGMPVFDWTAMKKEGYRWWIDRLKKNRDLFDLVRLDHFRAFSDYWEVPSDAVTARKGEWKKGPGADFFEAVQKELHEDRATTIWILESVLGGACCLYFFWHYWTDRH